MNIEIGRNLIKKRDFIQALNFFLRLEKKEKDKTRIYFFLGLIYSELNNYKKSIENYKKCLNLQPELPQAMFNLAIEKQNIGKVQEAKSIYLEILEKNKFNIRIYFALYSLNPDFISNEYYDVIDEIEKSNKLNLNERSLLCYLKSKNQKKKKNKEKEIFYLRNFHKFCYNDSKIFNEQSQYYYSKIINKFFNNLKFENETKNSIKNFRPIFIIGLPRSGSTLIESILTSSKHKILSAGECNYVNMCMVSQLDKNILVNKMKINEFSVDLKKTLIFLKKNYESINVLNNDIFVDKSLENFFNIDLILKIFPKAKFIHSYRDYNDSVISIYQSFLNQLSWTHSIKDILDYVDNYIKIIDYFNRKYKDKILNINLKDLTNNKKIFSKKIFDFCKLEWSESVLDFYKRKNLLIKTLSNSQVRNKIFQYKDKKYQDYYYLFEEYKNKYPWLK